MHEAIVNLLLVPYKYSSINWKWGGQAEASRGLGCQPRVHVAKLYHFAALFYSNDYGEAACGIGSSHCVLWAHHL